MADATCSIEGCDKPVRSRGWCQGHYSRWRTTGDPIDRRPTPEQRFHSMYEIDAETGCWEWTGTRNGGGYGKFGVSSPRRNVYAHRWAWEWANGRPVPEGLQIDHLCSNRCCVNPDHLEAVTARVNTERSSAPWAIVQRTGVCSAGLHDLTDPANIGTGRSGTHWCIPCREDARQRRMAEREAGTRPHGTQAGYVDGCRCGECTEAHATYARKHRADQRTCGACFHPLRHHGSECHHPAPPDGADCGCEAVR